MFRRPGSRLHPPRSALARANGTSRRPLRRRVPAAPSRVGRTARPGVAPPAATTRTTPRGAANSPHSRAKPRSAASVSASHEPHGFVQKRRFLALNLLFILLFGVVLFPMVRLQVTQPEKFVDLARKQRIRSVSIKPERGDLVDRSGIPLAISQREWRIVADPKIVQKTNTVASSSAQLAQLLGVDQVFLRDRMSQPKRYVPLVAGIDETAWGGVQALNLPGISMEETPRRVYPAGDVARSVLGRVGRIDHEGVSGLEKKFDSDLRGVEGTVLAERARWGKQIPAGERSVVPAKRGTTYVLTIDSALNYATDGMLAQAIANTNAKGGTLVVADIASGDVLALSTMRTSENGDVRPSEDNQALVSVFEPGSTNKVITIAAALEEHVVGQETQIRVPDHLNVSDHRFKDDEPHAPELWTPGQILSESSNIGTIKIAQALRSKTLDKYLRGFGLGQKTSIDFPGESAGLLLPVNKWTGTSIGTVPIGQGLAVTSMQMLSVYSTIANGGVHLPLRLVRGTIDANGKEHQASTGQSYRVVSAGTAGLVTKMLESVVAKGTGLKAQIKGYTVAGKTGTAQKPNLHSRGYQADAYVASFAGFFPSERPRLAIIAVLDEPKTSIYGGAVAAPLFAEAALFAGQHYRIPPSTGTEVSATAQTSADVAVHNAEMRAVTNAGTWQQAAIRRAAVTSPNPTVGIPSTTIAPAVSNPSPTPTPATVAPPPTVPVPTLATTTTAATIPDLSRHGGVATPPRAVVSKPGPTRTATTSGAGRVGPSAAATAANASANAPAIAAVALGSEGVGTGDSANGVSAAKGPSDGDAPGPQVRTVVGSDPVKAVE
jgi:cell division protein FtsI (penicillin-binding protein 3)